MVFLLDYGIFYPIWVLFYMVELDRDLPHRKPVIYLFFSIPILKDNFSNGVYSLP